MWVQLHNLPIGISFSAAKSILSEVGKVFENNPDEKEYKGSNFVHVRVGVDITKPLCRGRKLVLRNGQESWVCFKYERMPNICQWCGKLTHMDRNCPIWLKGKQALKKVEQQFGSRMRATTPNLARKSVVRVAGFDENDSETEDSVQANEVVRHGNVDNHETRIFSHDTVTPILMEQVIPQDDIEMEVTGVKSAQVVEDKCDNTLRTNSTHVVVSTGGVGFSDREPSKLDFHNQLQEIDREITRYDSSEGGSKEGEDNLQTSVGGHPPQTSTEEGRGISMTEQHGTLKEGKGKIKSGYTRSTIRNQTKGKGVIISCSPKEGKRVTSLKSTFQDVDGEGEESDVRKKQKGVGLDDLMVEAVSQPCRQL